MSDGTLEVTRGFRVSLNVYGDDGKPIAYNKCEMWAEVKAATADIAESELKRQVEDMLSDYETRYGARRSAPAIPKSDQQKQKEFVDWFCSKTKLAPPAAGQSYESWGATLPKETYDKARSEYIAINKK